MANRVNFVWLHGYTKWDMKEGDDYKNNIRPTTKGSYWAQFEIDIQTEMVDKKTGDIVYYHDTPTCRTFNQDHIKMLRGLGKGSEIDIKGELQKRDYKKDGEWKKGVPVIVINKLIVVDRRAPGELDAQRKRTQQPYNDAQPQPYKYDEAAAPQAFKEAQPEWMQMLNAEPLYEEKGDEKMADVPF